MWQATRMTRRAAAVFRPHLHQADCRICAAAAPLLRTANDAAPSSDPAIASSAQSSSPVVRHRGGQAAPSAVVDRRRAALQEWLQTFSESERRDGTSAASAKSTANAITTSVDFDAAYATYLNAEDAALQEVLRTRLADCLDARCMQASHDAAVHMDNVRTSVRIPRHLVVPAALQTGAPRTLHPHNDFEAFVRQRFAKDGAAVAKQLAFQTALLAMQAVLAALGVRFFLACGTALAARREGHFIPHDEDIDLGLFYSDLAAGPSPPDGVSAAAPAGLHLAQERVHRLLSTLAASRSFVVFDVCGAVEKGLELRALHLDTNTRIDLNVYYPAISDSDAALVREEGEFVWASSFYEAADSRRHRMYRYRHKPFASELEELPFCARTPTSPRFLVPPERYVEENYGPDWRTPKSYTYADGLAGEFKNIVAE